LDPTTTTGAILVGAQTFSSYLQGFAPHWIFIVAGMVGALLATLFIYSATASILLATLTTTVGLVAMAWLGFIPWWIVGISGIVAVTFFYSTCMRGPVESEGQEEDMTNQLIQKSPEELAIQRSKFKERTLPEDFRPSDTWPSGLPKSRPVTVQTLSLEDKVSSLLKDSNFDKGQRVFTSLKAEHDGIIQLFSGSKVNDTLINVEKTKSAVEDVYSKGLTFIEQATLVSKQIGTTDVNTLQLETDELTEQLKNHPVESTVGKTLKQVIDKNANILSLVKKNKDSIDELLCQVSLCKDSIEEIRLTLPSLINYTSADDLQKPIAELQQRVDFAQKLHDEFKAQGL
jgi:hypothetical protein